MGTGNSGDGGDVLLYAGESSALGSTGGDLILTAGEGSSTATINGGNGGKVQVFGGAAQGGNPYDDGGKCLILILP